jgi:hypothetical protein
MAQGDIEELRVPGESRGQEFLSSKKRSCVENYFVLTGGPLWTTMRALRGHFGLGGMGTRFVEVEVLLKERFPVHGSCEERFLLSRKKYSRGVT